MAKIAANPRIPPPNGSNEGVLFVDMLDFSLACTTHFASRIHLGFYINAIFYALFILKLLLKSKISKIHSPNSKLHS